MKTRRFTAAVAAAAAGVLVLSACTSGGGPKSGGGETVKSTSGGQKLEGCLQDKGIKETKDGEIKFTTGEQEWSGYNGVLDATYSTYNSVINGQMSSGFIYYGPDGTICKNEDFGTMKVVSGLNDDKPLVIEYTISDKAKWSDGTPITVNDYLMDWAVQNPEFLVPGYANGEDKAAKPVFKHVSTSFPKHVPDGPKGEPGSKTFTVTYPSKYPDWQLVIGTVQPSHVVAKQIGLTGDQFAKAIIDRDAETVKKAAKFWNEGWLSDPGQLPDPAIAPSSGPYRLKAGGWVAGQTLTLEANPDYWGTPAATKLLTFRFMSAGQHVQTLANRELNVIEPQATVDTVDQLKALGDQVKVVTGSNLTWEHLDFNFLGKVDKKDQPRTPNIFSDDGAGLKAREAFALCVPRQQIVDRLIKPISPSTVVMNAREVFASQGAKYEEVVKASYDGRFDKVDIEAAKKKFEEAGLKPGVKVRIGYNGPNPRRAETVELIKSSCDKVGFSIEDAGNPEFFKKVMPAGDYDVALFAWAGSGQIASGQNIYGTNKPQNYGSYTNAKVDAAWEKLTATLDPKVHLEQTKVIEKELWDTLFGIPLYAHPNVVAYTAGLENVYPTATQDGVSWNAFQWAWAQ